MKNNIWYLITFASILVFTGCGDKSKALDPTEKETKKEEKTDKTIPDKKIESESLKDDQLEAIDTGVKLIEEGIQDDKTELLNVEDGVVYFDFDKYNIRSDMQPVVEKIASLINMKNPNSIIKVEGNCDEWGTDEYNYALGLRRAKSIKDRLTQYGVSKDNLKLVSYGESNPTCSEHNEECWSKNRRVELKIIQ